MLLHLIVSQLNAAKELPDAAMNLVSRFVDAPLEGLAGALSIWEGGMRVVQQGKPQIDLCLR